MESNGVKVDYVRLDDTFYRIEENDIYCLLESLSGVFDILKQNIEEHLDPKLRYRHQCIQHNLKMEDYYLEVYFEFPGGYKKPWLKINAARMIPDPFDWHGIYQKLLHNMIGALWFDQESDFAWNNIVIGNTSIPFYGEDHPGGYGKIKDYVKLGRPLTWLEQQEEKFIESWEKGRLDTAGPDTMIEAVWIYSGLTFWSNIVKDPNTDGR